MRRTRGIPAYWHANLYVYRPNLCHRLDPGYKKLSSLSIEPDDAITLRARVIRFKYLATDSSSGSDDVFATLRRLVERITDAAASEKDLAIALGELATLFGSQHTSVSSFELLQSGVIDGLLQFFADPERAGRLSPILV